MEPVEIYAFAEHLKLSGASIRIINNDKSNYLIVQINGICYCWNKHDGRYNGWHAQPGSIFDNINESIQTILGSMGDSDG